MNIDNYISALIRYGLNKGLFEPCDKIYMTNRLLEILKLDHHIPADAGKLSLETILRGILDDAVQRGIIQDTVTDRDLLDTMLMGSLTPPPRDVRSHFAAQYKKSPQAATNWFYEFSQDTDYIRRYRIQKDAKWKTKTEYGNLDITINLSKPEKDPRAISAARTTDATGYPPCQLCVENEGYAGHIGHPARQNHRLIPVELAGEDWFLQYSPYVYYKEHCIVLNREHHPMVMDRSVFQKLLDFVTMFPHYFIGSNADLPIVGGSILTHEHFQGGCYSFPMERAPIEYILFFKGFDDVKAGIVKWPMNVIRLTCPRRERLIELADIILHSWRVYTDEAAFIFSRTNDGPHNTVTPIARKRGKMYELDLVLRNNITTDAHPLGVFHPHAELHHIKKENIGLIEVMGLAVLPSRLKDELKDLQNALLHGYPLTDDLIKHAHWMKELKEKYTFTPENAACILKLEVGQRFKQVLEHAGVFKRTPEGMKAFRRFIETISDSN